MVFDSGSIRIHAHRHNIGEQASQVKSMGLVRFMPGWIGIGEESQQILGTLSRAALL